MIRRETSEGWALISQLDHAHLAFELARAWGNEATPGLPLGEWLLPAVRGHDDGWFEWERHPDEVEPGVPRSFTEMPADVAVSIWSRSIAMCAGGSPSLAEAMRRLRSGGREVAIEEAAGLDVLVKGGRRFRREHYLRDMRQMDRVTEKSAAGTLARFEEEGIVAPLGEALGQPFYESLLALVGGSPLAGLWVSGHFQFLARQMAEHRADEPDVAPIVDRFLEEQAMHCGIWRETVADFAGAELDRVIDTGLRYLQLFDRISLWLCMAERTETWEARLSEQRVFTFRPEQGRIIAVSPWPFAERALELSVPTFDGERCRELFWRLVG